MMVRISKRTIGQSGQKREKRIIKGHRISHLSDPRQASSKFETGVVMGMRRALLDFGWKGEHRNGHDLRADTEILNTLPV